MFALPILVIAQWERGRGEGVGRNRGRANSCLYFLCNIILGQQTARVERIQAMSS